MEPIVVLLWFGFSILAGAVASSKGRSGIGYFILALFLSPLIGLLAAALMPSLVAAKSEDRRPRVPCPKCAELILVSARKCKYCGEDLAPYHAAVAAEKDLAHKKNAQEAAERAKRARAVGRAVGSWFAPRK